MTYKNKLYFLTALIAVMVLLYSGSLILNSDIGTKRSSFAWMDSKTAEKTTKIAVSAGEEKFELIKQNKMWVVLYNGNAYPARDVRVQDFLSFFTTRDSWQVRSSSASTHERFGLGADASSVSFYADNVLQLELLLGYEDPNNRSESFFRRQGQNEVRSGNSSISAYVSSAVSNWYNLRLVSDSGGSHVDLNTVQRLSIYAPDETQIFTRRNRGWVISGIEIADPDIPAIESYIRGILSAEGDNFSDTVSVNDQIYNHSRLVLELGNGNVVTIRLSDPDESGRVFANVSGSELIYSIPAWSAGRLFREAASFEMQ